MNNKSLFVKLTPLTEPMPRGEFEIEKMSLKSPIEIKYIDDEGDIAVERMRRPSPNEHLTPDCSVYFKVV